MLGRVLLPSHHLGGPSLLPRHTDDPSADAGLSPTGDPERSSSTVVPLRSHGSALHQPDCDGDVSSPEPDLSGAPRRSVDQVEHPRRLPAWPGRGLRSGPEPGDLPLRSPGGCLCLCLRGLRPFDVEQSSLPHGIDDLALGRPARTPGAGSTALEGFGGAGGCLGAGAARRRRPIVRPLSASVGDRMDCETSPRPSVYGRWAFSPWQAWSLRCWPLCKSSPACWRRRPRCASWVRRRPCTGSPGPFTRSASPGSSSQA